MGKKFLYVGNWGFHPAPKGISRFLYEEETGELTLAGDHPARRGRGPALPG